MELHDRCGASDKDQCNQSAGASSWHRRRDVYSALIPRGYLPMDPSAHTALLLELPSRAVPHPLQTNAQ